MAKSPRQTSDNVLAMPMSEPAATNGGSESMDDAVARRAYELYCARGSQDGHDVEDWLTSRRRPRPNISSVTVDHDDSCELPPPERGGSPNQCCGHSRTRTRADTGIPARTPRLRLPRQRGDTD